MPTQRIPPSFYFSSLFRWTMKRLDNNLHANALTEGKVPASWECARQASSPPAPAFQNENTHSPAPARGRREKGAAAAAAARLRPLRSDRESRHLLPASASFSRWKAADEPPTRGPQAAKIAHTHIPASRHTPGSDEPTWPALVPSGLTATAGRWRRRDPWNGASWNWAELNAKGPGTFGNSQSATLVRKGLGRMGATAFPRAPQVGLWSPLVDPSPHAWSLCIITSCPVPDFFLPFPLTIVCTVSPLHSAPRHSSVPVIPQRTAHASPPHSFCRDCKCRVWNGEVQWERWWLLLCGKWQVVLHHQEQVHSLVSAAFSLPPTEMEGCLMCKYLCLFQVTTSSRNPHTSREPVSRVHVRISSRSILVPG
jgi:hypothetical protein